MLQSSLVASVNLSQMTSAHNDLFYFLEVHYHKITLIINEQMHYTKFHIKTLKIAPTCLDPKIILRELRCSLLKSF